MLSGGPPGGFGSMQMIPPNMFRPGQPMMQQPGASMANAKPDMIPEEVGKFINTISCIISVVKQYLNKNGKLMWFAGPPLILPRPRQVRASMAYLQWAAQNKHETTQRPGQVRKLILKPGKRVKLDEIPPAVERVIWGFAEDLNHDAQVLENRLNSQ